MKVDIDEAGNGWAGGGQPAGTCQPAALGLLLDELAHGTLVVQTDGRLIHANNAARREIARARILAVIDGWVHATVPDAGRALKAALAGAALGKRSLVALHALDGHAHLMAVVPLPANDHPGAEQVALLLARAAVCDPIMLCFFARHHALTPTEEQVLGVLCQGHSAPQIARQLNVAVSTVRSHVRSLCGKTRSSGVRELVNRVAVLPPVAVALRGEPVH